MAAPLVLTAPLEPLMYRRRWKTWTRPWTPPPRLLPPQLLPTAFLLARSLKKQRHRLARGPKLHARDGNAPRKPLRQRHQKRPREGPRRDVHDVRQPRQF